MQTLTKAMDARLATLCGNVMKSKIQLFTIRVEVTEGASEVLEACCFNLNALFDVKDSSCLPAVFTAIAEQISDLRIAN